MKKAIAVILVLCFMLSMATMVGADKCQSGVGGVPMEMPAAEISPRNPLSGWFWYTEHEYTIYGEYYKLA